MRTTRALQKVKDANDGEIPNKLYLEPSKRLCDLIEDFTKIRPADNATTKELATHILELIKTVKVEINPPLQPQQQQEVVGGTEQVGNKRKAEEITEDTKNVELAGAGAETAATGGVGVEAAEAATIAAANKKKTAKPPRWAVEALDPLNIAEMKRMLFVPTQELYDRYTAGDLMLMWNAMGMKTEYPLGSWTVGKYDTIEKMKLFASRNLEYHHVN